MWAVIREGALVAVQTIERRSSERVWQLILAIEDERVNVAPGVELCAYRVVQEALTNVIKHSPASVTTVFVRYRQNELDLEVTSDRLGPSHSDGEGHGLVGMRERVSLYGGEFQAGTIAGGGFRIHALLPLDSFRR